MTEDEPDHCPENRLESWIHAGRLTERRGLSSENQKLRLGGDLDL
jgi:hypothetical protein